MRTNPCVLVILLLTGTLLAGPLWGATPTTVSRPEGRGQPPQGPASAAAAITQAADPGPAEETRARLLPRPSPSLWSARSRSLIADRRAAAPGDVISILIVERSTTSHQASHKADKELEVSGGPGAGLLGFFPDLSLSTDRATSGSGATTQSTRLVDRISGVVVGVTPEGNLRIEASRRVTLNRDELTLTLSGLVRPDDVAPDNSILSTQIADCRMGWSGSGPIPGKQRPGLISALLSLLW